MADKSQVRVREKHKRPNRKKAPGHYLRMLTYRSFTMMLERCYNPKHVSYKDYGGRGIHVFDRWLPAHQDDPDKDLGPSKIQAFERFLADVGKRPDKKHTLDRIDANGHYVPGNVRWSTHKEQGVNKRGTHHVYHPTTGEVIAAATLADELGIPYQNLRFRMMKQGTWYKYTLAMTDEPKEEVKDLDD